MPLPTEKLGEQAGLAMRPEGQTLGPGRETTLLPPSPFYLAALPSPWEPSIPTPQQNFSEDLILRIVLLKQTLCRILKVTKMSLGRHCDPLQRVRDVFAIISQTQAVVCCNSPFPS